jgi:hypothetical protein
MMPAAMAAAVATGKATQEPSSAPSFQSWSASGTAPVTSLVVANASSPEGATAAATAAQVAAGEKGNTGTLVVRPPPPVMVGEPAADQRPSIPTPEQPDMALLAQQQQQGQAVAAAGTGGVATAAAAGAGEGSAGKVPSPKVLSMQSIDIPDAALGSVQGVLAPESLPPLNHGGGEEGQEQLSPFVSPYPELLKGVTAAPAAGGGGGAAANSASARAGSSAAGSQGAATLRQQQLRSGSFTVIKEGRPMTDASVPYGLGSRHGSITSPHSSSSGASTHQQEALFAISPSRLSLSEAGGSEGVSASLPSNAALHRQGSTAGSSKLHTPFAIMTQAPSRSQGGGGPSGRTGVSSSGQDGASAWPFGQLSGSSGGGLVQPLTRRVSGPRTSSSLELSLSQSQLATVASSDGSGSWHGAAEVTPVVGVRAKMLQTSEWLVGVGTARELLGWEGSHGGGAGGGGAAEGWKSVDPGKSKE